MTREEEKALAEYCIKMSEMGFGLGREDVMQVAFAIALKSGRPHSFKMACQEEGGWKGLCEDSQDFHCKHLNHLALHEQEYAQVRP